MSKDIDNLFSDKMENEIKNEIKKKRGRLNLKLILTAIVSTLVIIIMGNLALNFFSNIYIKNAFNNEKQKLMAEDMIMNPNEYIGRNSCLELGYFKFESTYNYAKRIGSKVIYSGQTKYLGGIIKNGFSLNGSTLSNIPLSNDINKRYSTVYGLRRLYFLYPYVHYGSSIYDYRTDKNKPTDEELSMGKENIINDFHFLNEIGDDKIVEMALSFNKEYTYDEVNNNLSSNLITFYWVDNNSEDQKENNIEACNIAFDVVGIKSTYGAGEYKDKTDERIVYFKAALNQLKAMGDIQHIRNIDENNIKIIGAVVVGSPRELKKIQDNPMIKHAVIGTVVDKY